MRGRVLADRGVHSAGGRPRIRRRKCRGNRTRSRHGLDFTPEPGVVAGVTINWKASCDPPKGDTDPQDWSWSVEVGGSYADGHDAFDSGYVGPTVGATTWISQQSFAVEFEHEQDRSETISWKAILSCGSNQTNPFTLGSGSFTIRKSSDDGSGGGGSGSAGTGSRSGGTGSRSGATNPIAWFQSLWARHSPLLGSY